MIRVAGALRRKALYEGGACMDWLVNLGELVGEIEEQWSITVGDCLEGGTASFVAGATTGTGEELVLKLAMPAAIDGREALENEARTLELAGGRGCARLLRHDEQRGALLLERLGGRLDQLRLPVREQLELTCASLQAVWAVPAGDTLQSGEARGRWLANYIASMWDQLGQPCSASVAEAAIECADRRADAFDPRTAVLVHGNPHATNVLEDPSAPGKFRFVDPDGLAAEREYDLGILMREFSQEFRTGDPLELGRARAGFLAEITGADPDKIWEWAIPERLANGLGLLRLGETRLGDQFLRITASWAGHL